METNVNYTIVGVFVITLLMAIVLGIIWLSSGFRYDSYSTYIVYMQESVAGLSIDSPVEFNGVDVGSVKQIQLNRKNPQLVELLLNIKHNTPITMGTVATLTTRGVTGVTYIALKDKSTDLRPLIIGPGERYPVIKTAPSLFMRLDTALNQITTNLHQVSESIQSVLDKDNQRSIKETLQNLSRVTGTLAENSARMNEILENTAKASQRFQPLLKASESSMRILETQTLPSAYRTLNNIDQVARTLSEVAVELKQNPAMLVRGTYPPALGPGEKR